MNSLDKVEELRVRIQDVLDDDSQIKRNKLGQFATPSPLALDIVACAKTLISSSTRLRFFDPAFGTGAFYSALLRLYDRDKIELAFGFEIDERYGSEARRIWNKSPLKLVIADFTAQCAPKSEAEKANLVICNPPYVRHHHLSISEKERMRQIVKDSTGIRLSGLAGLYCYFMLMSHKWMTRDGIAGWLVPSEFLDVNYGIEVKRFLLENVMLLRIHRFDPSDVQFSDADVSSAVVWFKNTLPKSNHNVRLTHGGTLENPARSNIVSAKELAEMSKWTFYHAPGHRSNPTEKVTKLSDLFGIKRGIATGSNDYFILDEEKVHHYKIPSEFLIPILPTPRKLATDKVDADENEDPIVKHKLFLLKCELSEESIKSAYPSLWEYLKLGLKLGVDKRYLCEHRSPWYSQEDRPAAPFLCSYFGRKTGRREAPFRFILNRSRATASNSYLMLYPMPNLQKALDADARLYGKVWECLKKITSEELIRSGRVYGGGLHKLEPAELSTVPADGLYKELPLIGYSKARVSRRS